MADHKRNRKHTAAYCGYQFCYIKHVIDTHADILGRGKRTCDKPDCELQIQFQQQVANAGIPPVEYSNYHVKNYLHEDAQCREIVHGVRCKNIVPHFRYKYQNYRCVTHDPWNKSVRASQTTQPHTQTSPQASMQASSPPTTGGRDDTRSVQCIPVPKAPTAQITYVRVSMFDKAWGDESSDDE